MTADASARVVGASTHKVNGVFETTLDLEPFRTTYADAAWALSQLEYLRNNFEASLEWAHVAADHGLIVRKWHLEFLESLKNVNTYTFLGPVTERVALRSGRPDVPRVEVMVNKTKNVVAIVDSGAVMSIVSRKLAASIPSGEGPSGFSFASISTASFECGRRRAAAASMGSVIPRNAAAADAAAVRCRKERREK